MSRSKTKPAAHSQTKKKRRGPLPGSRKNESRRHEERDRARTKILTSATRLFAQRGIENVTFGDIARRARISRPLVYFYFPNLRSLFLEAALLAGQSLQNRLTQAVSGAPTGLDSIVSMGRGYVEFHEAEPDLFYLCMASIGPQPNGRRPTPTEERIIGLERSMLQLVEAVVARGVQDGSVRPDVKDTLTMALSLWAFVQGLAQLSSGHRETIERYSGLGPKAFLDAGFATLRGALTLPPVGR